jgi:hypothetical protein
MPTIPFDLCSEVLALQTITDLVPDSLYMAVAFIPTHNPESKPPIRTSYAAVQVCLAQLLLVAIETLWEAKWKTWYLLYRTNK